MDEFRLILRKLEKEMKQVFHEVKFAMEAVMKLIPDASFSQSVSLLFMVLSLLLRVDVFNINRDIYPVHISSDLAVYTKYSWNACLFNMSI